VVGVVWCPPAKADQRAKGSEKEKRRRKTHWDTRRSTADRASSRQSRGR
jgi:hypothetical protein